MLRARVLALARRLLGRSVAHSQSNEAALLDELLRDLRVPRTFCEFGFDAGEFNCARLMQAGWRGLLIDGNAAKVESARAHLGSHRRAVTVLCQLLDQENVRANIARFYGPRELGVLSVDVDGNDYWLLRELFPLAPGLIVCEYNASFLLHSLTVPYDPQFDRHAKHPLGFYHGASLSALTSLCAAHYYDLVAVSESGLNAIFRRAGVGPPRPPLTPAQAYRPNALRHQWHGLTPEQQWESVRDLPFVQV